MHTSEATVGPRFDLPVDPGGYAWWYVDALSDDGAYGLTIIGFVGSVFSPYYAWSGRKSPENHCAINVALYGDGVGRWAMTERSRASLSRTAQTLKVGPSSIRWHEDHLAIDFDEVGCPLPRPVKGQVRVYPILLNPTSFALDSRDRHHWWPLAPLARVEAELTAPSNQWQGHGYLDSNWGSEALEDGFSYWTWSRTTDGDRCSIVYDVDRRDGSRDGLALEFSADGVERFEPPALDDLGTGFWGVARRGRGIQIARRLEDSPFYTRSEVTGQLAGRSVRGVHESLDLNRFRSRWVKWMLPFRMPRRASGQLRASQATKRLT